uniref:Cell proliferation regulating inhibitor of protein phosphatase 2A n=1 Tax=Cyprinus carpio TaxID=7962 RepID=A0A8C1K5E8_CYPCA
MDVSTCLKSLLLAIRQYRNNRSTVNASQLQKHIEDVSGLKCGGVLFSGQVLPSECLSGLMEVAGDPNTSHALTGSIIFLLAQFVSDGEAKEAFHSSYNFTGTLAAIIHCNRTTPEEPLVLQVRVLQFKIKSTLHSFNQSCNDDIVKACLGLMANLCRHDISVQSHIKSQSNVKAFYRALINLLGHNCLTVVVFVLSILSSLTLNEEVGQKLFNAKNIHQTFQLIFNITVNGDGTLTRNYAVDLLVDLLKNPKIADNLTKYKHLSVCLSEVLGLLHTKDPDTASKVMELLVALCSVPVLRKHVCETVLRPPAARLQPGTRKGVQARGSEPSLALVHWVLSPLDGPEQCYMQALSLLAELFEEAIDSSLCSSAQSFVELLLQEVLVLLQSPDSTEGDQLLKKHCLRAGRVVDFLLDILNFKDQRMVTPLSLALTSNCREHVQVALRILVEAAPLPDFPSIILGDSIAANNAYCQRDGELSIRSSSASEDVSLVGKSFPIMHAEPPGSAYQSIDSLIEKLQSGVEVKDVHMSEIIDVYEQKLSALACKESRLQDLLEAKALALSQADRLIAQYRCQRAQAEAEARKLASLLKDTERKKEDLQTELNDHLLEVERLKSDSQQLLEHNGRLQAVADQHQELKGTYNQLLSRSVFHTHTNTHTRKQHFSPPGINTSHDNVFSVVVLILQASSLELQKSQLEAKVEKMEEELSKHTQMIAMIHSLSSGKLKGEITASLSL